MSATTAANDADWSTRGNCRGRETEFFPENGEHADPRRTTAICRACKVTTECLANVMRLEGDSSAETRYGMYAELTGRERYELHKADPRRWTS